MNEECDLMERRRKKTRKMRGRREMGYGCAKGHRAAGQRGGKGNAGSKKYLKMKYLKADPRYFGKHGFDMIQGTVEPVDAMNVGTLDASITQLVQRGVAKQSGKKYSLDVSLLGVDKILGSGKVAHALELTGVKSLSPKAREKITSAGGSVDTPTEEK
jgi:large subunit ribosomal protein L15